MKTRKFNKKLNLNKKTVVDLEQKEMLTVKGGELAPFTYYTCLAVTCKTECDTVCGSQPCC